VAPGAEARVKAVLDTSFWVMAYRADVAANCLDLFDMVPPRAVEAEIAENDPLFPNGEFPYATLFRQLRDRMSNPPDPEPPPLDVLGAGEAAVIPLARLLGVPALINEAKAKKFAVNSGIDVITVPTTIVALFSRGVISNRAAWRKLELIEPNTAAEIIQDAASALSFLGA
jgi:hypothetical protein